MVVDADPVAEALQRPRQERERHLEAADFSARPGARGRSGAVRGADAGRSDQRVPLQVLEEEQHRPVTVQIQPPLFSRGHRRSPNHWRLFEDYSSAIHGQQPAAETASP
jgi:hypothetical protein